LRRVSDEAGPPDGRLFHAFMLIRARCHCGNIRLTLDWPDVASAIPARACGCSFCIKHGGVWTSHPAATLEVDIDTPSQVSEYAFATGTATFHVCARCGVVPFVTCELGQRTHAVVNVNTFEDVDPSRISRAMANFDGEDLQARLARRARNWIGTVRVRKAASGR
jgi:hypothetical protein